MGKFDKREVIDYMQNDSCGWPLFDPSWNESNFNWVQNDASFSRKGLYHDSLIYTTVYPDSIGTDNIVAVSKASIICQNILH